MNYLIQRGKVRGQMINVPDGLPELLSDITREVLRCQPSTECLCQFVIDYLHSIIVTREKARVAKYIIDDALKQVDEIISDLCICDIPKSTASEMAIIMEQSFKRFLEKYRCERRKDKELVKFDEIDILDELIKKCKLSKNELLVSQPLIEEAYNRFVKAYMTASEANEGTEALYEYFRNRELKRIEQEIQTKAATKIQAVYRGYKVRRSLQYAEKLQEIYVPTQHFEEADREIQKLFRTGPFLEDGTEGPFEICSPKSELSIDPYAALGELEVEEMDVKEKVSIEHVVDVDQVADKEVEQAIPAVSAPIPEPAPEPAPEPEPEPVAVPEPAAEPEPVAQEPEPEPAPQAEEAPTESAAPAE